MLLASLLISFILLTSPSCSLECLPILSVYQTLVPGSASREVQAQKSYKCPAEEFGLCPADKANHVSQDENNKSNSNTLMKKVTKGHQHLGTIVGLGGENHSVSAQLTCEASVGHRGLDIHSLVWLCPPAPGQWREM